METEIIIRETIAKHEQDLKSVHHRLDNLENLTESVHIIAVETREMKKNLSGVSERVEQIERRPQKRRDTIITAVISAVAGAAAGYFFGI